MSTYLACWMNRTRIVSLAPYVAEDDVCDSPATKVVLVPSYGEPGMPEHWPVPTCEGHLSDLLADLTSEEGHGYPADDLTITSIDTSPEGVST